MKDFKKSFFRIHEPFSRFIKPSWFAGLSSKIPVLPLYHAVNDITPPHLKYLYKIRSEKEFKKDMEFLLKHYEPVSLQELMQFESIEKKSGRACFHLTFDDGLSEFSHVIAPILIKKGIPATCFLNYSFIDNKELFFRFKAGLLLDVLHHEKAGSPSWESYHAWIRDNRLDSGYYKNLILGLGYDQRSLLDDLAKKLQFSFKEYLIKYKPYLSSDEIDDLIGKGFTFGAHSMDHPEYYKISEDEQVRQTLESIQQITDRYHLSYKAFSFPFTDHGVTRSFFDKIFSGTSADITFGCAGIKADSIQNNFQRIPVERYDLSLQRTLQKEYAYFVFLRMLNKHNIGR